MGTSVLFGTVGFCVLIGSSDPSAQSCSSRGTGTSPTTGSATRTAPRSTCARPPVSVPAVTQYPHKTSKGFSEFCPQRTTTNTFTGRTWHLLPQSNGDVQTFSPICTSRLETSVARDFRRPAHFRGVTSGLVLQSSGSRTSTARLRAAAVTRRTGTSVKHVSIGSGSGVETSASLCLSFFLSLALSVSVSLSLSLSLSVSLLPFSLCLSMSLSVSLSLFSRSLFRSSLSLSLSPSLSISSQCKVPQPGSACGSASLCTSGVALVSDPVMFGLLNALNPWIR